MFHPALEVTSDAPTKGGNSHNIIKQNVIWTNQKTESFVYRWLHTHAMVYSMCFPRTFVEHLTLLQAFCQYVNGICGVCTRWGHQAEQPSVPLAGEHQGRVRALPEPHPVQAWPHRGGAAPAHQGVRGPAQWHDEGGGGIQEERGTPANTNHRFIHVLFLMFVHIC